MSKHLRGPVKVCNVCHYGIKSLNHVDKCRAKKGTYTINTMHHSIDGTRGGFFNAVCIEKEK